MRLWKVKLSYMTRECGLAIGCYLEFIPKRGKAKTTPNTPPHPPRAPKYRSYILSFTEPAKLPMGKKTRQVSMATQAIQEKKNSA